MSSLALALVLAGAVVHVGWNALAKDAEDGLAFLWLAILAPAAAGALAVPWAVASGRLGWAGGACIAGTGALHAAYFAALAGAYRSADLSFVYPYTRGAGAAGATAGGVLLLGETPSVLGWLGIGLALAAMCVEAIAGARGAGAPSRRGLALTAATAATIAGYLVLDKVGVGLVAAPLYLAGMMAATAALLAPLALRGGRARRELARGRWRPWAASAFMASGYGAVLFAMALAPVSYVVAARASGIAVSAVAGWRLFGERPPPGRWAAIAMIVLAVAILGVS